MSKICTRKRHRFYAKWLLRYGNFDCHYCRKPTLLKAETTHSYKSTIDHIIPISKGGTNRLTNLVLACNLCNRSKRNLDPSEFLMEKTTNETT